TFDETVFGLLYRTFWEKVMQYQITNVCSVVEVVDKLKKHNDTIKMHNTFRRDKAGKKQLTGFRIIAAALLAQKGVKMNEFKGFIPASTLRDIKRDLK